MHINNIVRHVFRPDQRDLARFAGPPSMGGSVHAARFVRGGPGQRHQHQPSAQVTDQRPAAVLVEHLGLVWGGHDADRALVRLRAGTRDLDRVIQQDSVHRRVH